MVQSQSDRLALHHKPRRVAKLRWRRLIRLTASTQEDSHFAWRYKVTSLAIVNRWSAVSRLLSNWTGVGLVWLWNSFCVYFVRRAQLIKWASSWAEPECPDLQFYVEVWQDGSCVVYGYSPWRPETGTSTKGYIWRFSRATGKSWSTLLEGKSYRLPLMRDSSPFISIKCVFILSWEFILNTVVARVYGLVCVVIWTCLSDLVGCWQLWKWTNSWKDPLWARLQLFWRHHRLPWQVTKLWRESELLFVVCLLAALYHLVLSIPSSDQGVLWGASSLGWRDSFHPRGQWLFWCARPEWPVDKSGGRQGRHDRPSSRHLPPLHVGHQGHLAYNISHWTPHPNI